MAGQGNFFDEFDDPVVDQLQEKRGADIRQSNAGVTSSIAGAEKSRADAVTENITRPDKARKLRAEADLAEQTAKKGPPKTDADIKREGALSRAAIVRAQMARLIGKYKTDIQGQPLSRGFGLFEKWFDEPIGPIPAAPSLSSFNSSSQQMLPLIRPLVAQSAKEGDSNTEMTIFERYIPSASDNDRDIEEKFQGLDMLLSGMAEGKKPTEVIQLGVKPRSIDEIQKDLAAAGTAPKDTVVDGNATTAATPQGQSIKGPRLSPEGASAVAAYLKSGSADPEGFARLVTAEALKSGAITPEQAGSTFADNLKAAQTFFANTPPEKAGPGGDYTETDRRAQESAGAGDVLMQAGANLPESAANLVQGALALPVDAVSSLLQGERAGSIKSITDLAGELVGMAGGDPKGPTTQAFVQMLEERYGGWDALKNTLATDPAGLAGDISLLLTGGGSAAARLPGVAGRVGSATATAGRVLDPLSAVVAGAEVAPKVAGAVIPDAVKNLPGATTGHVLGLSTGVPGGEGYRRAANIGYESGRTGQTGRSDRFLENLRGAPAEDVVAEAEQAVRKMQADASAAYKSGMVDTKNDATVLSFNGIDQTLNDLRESAFYKKQLKDPRAAAAHTEISAIVDEWKALDPAEYHTPEGMDALKQRVGDVAEKFTSENDRAAARVATRAYKQIRQAIVDQVPSYAKAMKQYEQASGLLRNIRKTFSLNPNATVDSQLRKLQSVMRNNANTSYGYRKGLVELMERNGGRGLLDDLSAQSISSLQPRGLSGIGAGGLAATGAAGMIPGAAAASALLNPAHLLALPMTSPRIMGEASYYAGKGAGTAARGGSAALTKLAQAYNANPTAALAMTQVGARGNELDEMSGRYDLDNIAMGYGDR